MNEILSRGYHKDPKTVRVNELPDHAYFIPFATEEEARAPREGSAFFHSLNGIWRFLWHPSVYEMQDFFAEGFDLKDFAEVTVPECWQAHGADRAQYQTSPYPFLNDPPYVPERNPVAAYVKDFDITPVADKRYELHFEGKDSCVYVWMNGSFVGYGEVPHNDSAFDVTPYLKAGANRLCVAVLKWCSGSYFDDQDKIRLSGLFRDVYILERAANGMTDFALTADANGDLALSVKANAPVRAAVYDGDALLASADVKGKWTWRCNAPRLWSAEAPHLYDLVLTCAGEVIRHRFGFRTVNIESGVFKLNGSPVKFYGVNRHDSSPDTGYVADEAFMHEELLLMKQHNVNAIRTSHYPSAPRFYEMCDELGFYVMCEADQECHGMAYIQNGWNTLVDDPLWADCIHDRMTRMYEAFKNSTSVVIWSLGNESGWGQNLDNEAVWFHNTDTTRPVHYESAFSGYMKYDEEELARRAKNLDFLSAMYPPLSPGVSRAHLQASLTHPIFAEKVYVMCEYSHSMGNSCGDLRFYDEFIQAYPNFAGGFIWEWCDHALRLTDEGGTSYFGYGGDFGELHHMHNVCMDGLVAPDRVPHSNLLEAKAVFAPLRVTRNEDGTLTVQNRHAFSDLSAYRLDFAIVADNVTVARGTLAADPAPCECVTLPCPANEPYAAKNAALTVTAVLAADTLWAKKGHTVAAFSFPLAVTEKKAPLATCAPELQEDTLYYTVSGDGFAYRFRRDTGLLESARFGGQELLSAPLALNCFRAPLDNDRGVTGELVAKEWRANRHFGNIEYTEASVRGFSAVWEKDAVLLGGDLVFGVQGRTPIAKGKLVYRIDGEGRLTLHQQGSFSKDMPYFLPRYGYRLSLVAPAEEIRYYGYGPAECYEDKISHALLGEYAYVQDDPTGNWERPQECGSHCHTDWLTLSCKGVKLRVSGQKFSFGATRFDIHEVTKTTHRKDLTQMDHTDLYIDYRMSGVGSHSCGGQDPVPDCRINADEQFDFSFLLEPLR